MIWIFALMLTMVQTEPVLAPIAIHEAAFVGFSRNEAAYAFRLHARREHPDGTVDTFRLIALFDSENRRLIATFQDGGNSRRPATTMHSSANQRQVAKPAKFDSANPEWQAALPNKAWQQLAKRERFNSIAHAFTDGLVRLMPDTDSSITAQAQQKALQLQGQKGAPLGFSPVIRLMDGTQLPLGHYRLEAQPEAVPVAQVRVYYSKSGRFVAITNHFRDGKNLLTKRMPSSLVLALGENPVGSVKYASNRMIDWQAKSMRKLFHDSAGDQEKIFDKFIGGAF